MKTDIGVPQLGGLLISFGMIMTGYLGLTGTLRPSPILVAVIFIAAVFWHTSWGRTADNRNKVVLKPDELDFVAKLVAIFSHFIAGFLLAVSRETPAAWVALVGGRLISSFSMQTSAASTSNRWEIPMTIQALDRAPATGRPAPGGD